MNSFLFAEEGRHVEPMYGTCFGSLTVKKEIFRRKMWCWGKSIEIAVPNKKDLCSVHRELKQNNPKVSKNKKITLNKFILAYVWVVKATVR